MITAEDISRSQQRNEQTHLTQEAADGTKKKAALKRFKLFGYQLWLINY